MAYTPTIWADGVTPVNAANLNKLEQGLDVADANADAAVAALPGKEDKTAKGAANGYASLDASSQVPDSQIPAAIARDAEVTSAIAGHAAAADPHTGYQLRSEKTQAGGYPSLDAGAKVPVAQLPDLSATYQPLSAKAAVNGYAPLDASAKVPAINLPTPAAAGADLSFDGDWVAGTYQDGDTVVKDGIVFLCVGGPTAVAPDAVPWGLASQPSPAGVIDRSATPTDLLNSTVETTLYSKLIAAGAMGIDRMLRLTMLGDFLHNAGIGDSMTLRVKLGATTIIAQVYGFNGAGAGRQPWRLVMSLANLGAANSQLALYDIFSTFPATGAPTTGIGQAQAAGSGDPPYGGIVSGTGAVDTTVAQTLTVTGQWSAASANNSWRKRYASLELV